MGSMVLILFCLRNALGGMESLWRHSLSPSNISCRHHEMLCGCMLQRVSLDATYR